jgi:hypothetical protein
MPLADPLIVTRTVLMENLPVTRIVGGNIFATPLLPKDHSYPLIRLTHIGSSGYANVPFRQSADAVVQVDMWAHDMPTLAALRDAALDALHSIPRHGLNSTRIKVTSEVLDVDEQAQPPLYRARADLAVLVVSYPAPVAP